MTGLLSSRLKWRSRGASVPFGGGGILAIGTLVCARKVAVKGSSANDGQPRYLGGRPGSGKSVALRHPRRNLPGMRGIRLDHIADSLVR